MPTQRNRNAAPVKPRTVRDKQVKIAKAAKQAARKPRKAAQVRKAVAPQPPLLRTPFFALPPRDAGRGEAARALAAAFRAFARMPRSKSRILH